MILIFLLTNYVFHPNLLDYEKAKIVKKYNIAFTIDKKSNLFNYEKLYKQGKYQEYIDNFEKYYKKLSYLDNIEKIYSYYFLSLKILKNKNYKNKLCIIKNSIYFFKSLPDFIIRDIPSNCNLIKINIEKNKNYKIFINQIPIKTNNTFINSLPYKLRICENNKCFEKLYNKKTINLNDIKNHLIIYKREKDYYLYSDNINKMKSNKDIHYFYKQNKKIYHSYNKKIEIILNENKITQKEDFKIYKKWYFYAGITTLAIATSVTLYFLLSSSSKNTNVYWESP